MCKLETILHFSVLPSIKKQIKANSKNCFILKLFSTILCKLKNKRLPLTLPNVISQYLFFFFSFYIFLFVSLSTIYVYCRTTETPKHLQMMIISEKTIISPLYYYEYLYKNILIGEFHIDNEIIEVKDRTGYFIGNMY